MTHLLDDHPDWPNAMTTPTPMERVKKIGSVIFYVMATIGILDMLVFSMSNCRVRMIHSALEFLFGGAR